MSDLLPTKEQELAAYAACVREYDTGRGIVMVADSEDVALLLAEREATLVGVICRLRECLHQTMPFIDDNGSVAERVYNDAFVALHDTEKYEVVE